MMKMVTPRHLDFIEKKSIKYLIDWMIDGFLSHYVNSATDAFYPHSHFGATGDPLFAIREAYNVISARSQTKLRRVVEGLLVVATPGAHFQGSHEMTAEIRLNLLSIISMLVAETGAIDGAPRLTHIVTTEIEGWGSAENQKQAFALALRSLVEIASKARMHSSFSRSAASILESSIIRIICSPHFDSKYVARCAFALLAVGEETFFGHYESLLRDHFSRMHDADSSELEHAHITADLIIDKLPKQFMKFAPSMEILGARPRGLWVLRAWDSPRSKFFLYRPDRNAGRLSLSRRNIQTGSSIRSPAIAFENNDFYKYQVHSTIDQGILALDGLIMSPGLRQISSIFKPPVAQYQGAHSEN